MKSIRYPRHWAKHVLVVQRRAEASTQLFQSHTAFQPGPHRLNEVVVLSVIFRPVQWILIGTQQVPLVTSVAEREWSGGLFDLLPDPAEGKVRS